MRKAVGLFVEETLKETYKRDLKNSHVRFPDQKKMKRKKEIRDGEREALDPFYREDLE